MHDWKNSWFMVGQMVLNKMDFVHPHPITIDISLKVEHEENVGFVSCIGLFLQ